MGAVHTLHDHNTATESAELNVSAPVGLTSCFRCVRSGAASRAATLVTSLLLVCVTGCASVSTVTRDTTPKNDVAVVAAASTGPKTRARIVRIDLPDSLLELYPELREKRVGWGLCNRLVDALYETGRFTLVEEKQAVIEKVMEQWALGQSGAVAEETAPPTGGLTAPQYLVYAEVYDFAVGGSEKVVGVASQAEKVTRLGVQVRLVDIATGEYTPASGLGEAVMVRNAILWASSRDEFDQSTVGKASARAVNTAVNQLIKRLGW